MNKTSKVLEPKEAYNLRGGVGRTDSKKFKINSHGDKSYEESKTGYCRKTDTRLGKKQLSQSQWSGKASVRR